MSAPASESGAAAVAEPAERTCSVLVESPSSKLFGIPNIYAMGSVGSLKESLKSIPELCLYTSYHLELQGAAPRALSEAEALESIEFSENSVLRMIPDGYTPFLLRHHVQNASNLFQSVSIVPEVDQEIHNLPESIERYGRLYSELREQMRQRSEGGAAESSAAAPEGAEAASAAPSLPVAPESVLPAAAAAPPALEVVSAGSKPSSESGKAAPVSALAAAAAAATGATPDGGESGGEGGGDALLPSAESALPLETDFAKIKEAIVKQRQETAELLEKFPLDQLTVDLSLSHYFESPVERIGFDARRARPIVRSIRFSGWNPVPANRKVLGDLGYIELETLEGELVIATATPAGFYVNKSRRDYFDPSPSAKPCHSRDLVELLKQVSPEFKKQYPSFLQSLQTDSKSGHRAWDSVVSMRVPEEVRSPGWLVAPVDSGAPLSQKHTYAQGEDESALSDPLHDWTEEYESILALPAETPNERVKKESILHQQQLQFTRACRLGVEAIASGDVEAAVVPGASEGSGTLYIYSNILFSRIDSKSALSRKASDQHLKATRAVSLARDESIHAPLATIVDYQGERYLAEAFIPGQLQGSAKVVYGRPSSGEAVKVDADVHAKLLSLLVQFGLGVTTVTEGGGSVVEVAGSPESRVVLGSDGQLYLTHMTEFYPRNLRAEGEKIVDSPTYLRPELLRIYYDYLYTLNRLKAEEKAQETHEDQIVEPVAPFSLAVGPDVVSMEDDLLSRLLAFLDDNLKELRVQLLMEKLPCASGEALCEILHSMGVNLHFLGPLSTLLAPNLDEVTSRVQFFVELVEGEMLARACKHVLHGLFELPHARHSAALIYSSLLNAVLGKPDESTVPALLDESAKVTRPNRRAVISGMVSQRMSSYMQSLSAALEPSALWSQIEARVSVHFGGNLRLLANPYKDAAAHGRLAPTVKLALLRSICQRCGIQLFQREYSFGTSTPVQPEDVAGSAALLKSVVQSPMLPSVPETLTTLNSHFAEGDYAQAYCKAVMLIALVFQECGHADAVVVACLRMMAAACARIRDFEGAEVHQRQALALEAELSGEGSVSLVAQLESLAQYQSQQGKTREAMGCLKRALYISDVATGEHNLHNIFGYLRLGSVMASIGHTPFAIECYKEALARSNTDATAQLTILRNLSVSEALMGNLDAAVHYEGAVQQISHALFGADEEHTKQSAHLLERLQAIKAEFDKK